LKTLKSTLIVSCLPFFLFACGQNPPANTAVNANGNSVAVPPTDTLAVGRKLYNQNCAACHKVSGTGGKMDFDGKTINPEDLTDDEFVQAPDEKLYAYIFDGVKNEGMPSFKEKLKEPEIREIVRFIRAELQKKKQ
jgi:mono/diheme cytochrome c family protein